MRVITCYRGVFEHQGEAPAGLLLDYQYSSKLLFDECFKRVERVRVTMLEGLTLEDLDYQVSDDVEVVVLEIILLKA